MWAGLFALDKQRDGGLRGFGALEKPPAAAGLDVLDILIGGLDPAEACGVCVRRMSAELGEIGIADGWVIRIVRDIKNQIRVHG